MKAVLDTNVLVSGMISPSGPPGRIVDLMRAGSLQAVVDDRILEEYSDVLRRPSMRAYFPASDAEAIAAFFAHNADHVLATVSVSELPDPDDAMFLEVALAAGVPLITGNTRHFPPLLRAGCSVLAPAEYLARFCGT